MTRALTLILNWFLDLVLDCFLNLVLSVSGVGGVCTAAHATAQLELSHVSHDGCGIEGLPPLALGKVLPHLPAH